MSWLSAPWPRLLAIFASAAGIYAVVILFTRLNGLRTFSKMSSFDFAMTVAMGSIIASTVLAESASLIEGAVALGALVLLQRIIAWTRLHWNGSQVVDNTPVVLMAGGRMFDDALARTRVTRADVYAKLREANVLRIGEVQAVVLEATGDMSVLHCNEAIRLDPTLLEGVAGAERVWRGR